MESVKFMACELWSVECGVETAKFRRVNGGVWGGDCEV